MPAAYKEHTDELVEMLRTLKIEPFDGPVSVDLTFLCTRPPTSKLHHPKPDIDNYAKTILDAITKAANIWTDDTQVVHLSAQKRWAAPETVAGTAVTIKPVSILCPTNP